MRAVSFTTRALGGAMLLCASWAIAQTPGPTDLPAGPPPLPAMLQWHALPGGLQYADIAMGHGAMPREGQTVIVHFNGWLDDGTPFDSTYKRGKPFGFPLGSGQVIKGWEEGVRNMRPGGKRRLVVPPQLGYGEQGIPPLVPPNATLVFDIELLRVIETPPDKQQGPPTPPQRRRK
jgi:peptidylprolyl isomerase